MASRKAFAGIVDGSLDAQENPLANTVTYGAHRFHRYHTLSNHFYISRPIFAHRDSVDAWPEEMRTAMYDAVKDSITRQRGLAEQEAIDARKAIEDEGCEIADLTEEEHDSFVQAVAPQHGDAREIFGDEVFEFANL